MIHQPSKLARRGPQRAPRPEIVVVCEGKVTEPKYFNEFRALHGNSLVTVTAIGGCGVPVSVVKRAVEERRSRALTARRSGDSFDSLYEVWAVFDRDEHPKEQFPEAFTLARENGINLAFSNPCFEVWGLMHFSCFDRPGHHHEAQSALKRQLDGYCHQANPIFDLTKLQMLYPDAVRNAERALERRQQEGRENGDPSTSVHLLTERIREFGRKS